MSFHKRPLFESPPPKVIWDDPNQRRKQQNALQQSRINRHYAAQQQPVPWYMQLELPKAPRDERSDNWLTPNKPKNKFPWESDSEEDPSTPLDAPPTQV